MFSEILETVVGEVQTLQEWSWMECLRIYLLQDIPRPVSGHLEILMGEFVYVVLGEVRGLGGWR